MPTKTGLATVFSALIALIAGRIFGIFELYVLAAAMLALVACAMAWVLLNRRSLRVERSVNPPRLHAGSSSTVTLSLSNTRLLRSPVARITDEVQGTVRADANVPPIARNATTRASYRVPTESRGLVEIGPMKTRITDPFAMASVTRTSAPDTTLLVLPRIDPIAPPPQPGGSTAQQMDRNPNRVGSHGDDFSSLRSYVLGDDLRKVHWPSSARTGDLVVRNEHIPEHGHSLVLLDVRAGAADPDTFERMVSAAASIVVACRDRGDRIQLMTTDGLDHTADTPRACDALLDLLALVQQSPTVNVTLPHRVGGGTIQAGAIVVADNSESLITSLTGGRNARSGACVVRFAAAQARPQRRTGRLPSASMIDVAAGEDFATAWSQAVRT